MKKQTLLYALLLFGILTSHGADGIDCFRLFNSASFDIGPTFIAKFKGGCYLRRMNNAEDSFRILCISPEGTKMQSMTVILKGGQISKVLHMSSADEYILLKPFIFYIKEGNIVVSWYFKHEKLEKIRTHHLSSKSVLDEIFDENGNVISINMLSPNAVPNILLPDFSDSEEFLLPSL